MIELQREKQELPIQQIGLFRVEIIVNSVPGGIYRTSKTHQRISELLLGCFLDRGLDARVIDPGNRGATGEAVFKIAPWLIRILTHLWKKHRRAKELEFSDETGWSVQVELQAFIRRVSPKIAINGTIEMLDVLKLAEARIRDSFGPDIVISGNLATFDNDSMKNLISVTIDPGVLEDSSRRWIGHAFMKVSEGDLVRIRRRPYLGTPKLHIDIDAPFPDTPRIESLVTRRHAGFDPEIAAPGYSLDG